jgi:four helix bundle protein
MSIASKEARETLYWIQLIESSNFINYNFSSVKNECESIIRILTAIVKTSQISLKNQ